MISLVRAALLLAICLSFTAGVSQEAYSSISSQGRIMRHEPAGHQSLERGSKASASGTSPVSVFIVTTPDEEHTQMLENLLCSLGDTSRHDTYVMMHFKTDSVQQVIHDLQARLRSRLGHDRVSVFGSHSVFGNHPQWTHLKHAFPSSIKMFGVRHILSKLAPESLLLVLDEDVVCSSDQSQAHEGRHEWSVAEEIAHNAVMNVSVMCAHEIPDVTDIYNNGFCLYRSSPATDLLLDAVEKRMALMGFKGDQTPFNAILRDDVTLAASSASRHGPDFPMRSSQMVGNFGPGVVGYLRTWTSDGFPLPGVSPLLVVDSVSPQTLVRWSPSLQPDHAEGTRRQGPLCLHYLPFSPSTHLWTKLERQCETRR